MGAPNRLGLALTHDGPTLFVRPIDPTEDRIYDAVGDAIRAGWDPARFLRTVRDAWAHELDEQKKAALKALSR